MLACIWGHSWPSTALSSVSVASTSSWYFKKMDLGRQDGSVGRSPGLQSWQSSLVPGTHVKAEEENRLHTDVLWLPCMHYGMCVHIHTHHAHMHTFILKLHRHVAFPLSLNSPVPSGPTVWGAVSGPRCEQHRKPSSLRRFPGFLGALESASTSRKAWWALREERNETSKDSCAGLTLVWELDKSMIPYVLRE